ncbi:hypothetical protein [Thalassospira povalilytica]|uniref:hypothetical protein n=1 Tax=Thalassospira povalilytica TaxID=732237 RepID=UPI003AA9774E
MHSVKTLFALIVFGFPQTATASDLDVPSKTLGVWNGWTAACMVDPFEGPKCGVEKNLFSQPENSQNKLNSLQESSDVIKQLAQGLQPRTAHPELKRVWITIAQNSEFVSFEISEELGDAGEIWNVPLLATGSRRSFSSFYFSGSDAQELISEISEGNLLYFRFQTGRPHEQLPPFEKVDLTGFLSAYKSAKENYSALAQNFPYSKIDKELQPKD